MTNEELLRWAQEQINAGQTQPVMMGGPEDLLQQVQAELNGAYANQSQESEDPSLLERFRNASIDALQQNVIGIPQAAGTAVGSKPGWFQDFGQAVAERAKMAGMGVDVLQRLAGLESPPPETTAEKLSDMIPGSVGYLAPYALGPAFGVGTNVAQYAADEINRVDEMGGDVGAALPTIGLSSAVKAGIEKLAGPERMLGRLVGGAASRGLAKEAIDYAVVQPVGEGLEEVGQLATDYATRQMRGEDTDWGQFAPEAGENFKMGALGSYILGAPVKAAQVLQEVGQNDAVEPEPVPEIDKVAESLNLPVVDKTDLLNKIEAARREVVAETEGSAFAQLATDRRIETRDPDALESLAAQSEAELQKLSVNTALNEVENLERALSVAGDVRSAAFAQRISGQAKGELTKLFNKAVRAARVDVGGINAEVDKFIDAVSIRMRDAGLESMDAPDQERFVSEEVRGAMGDIRLPEKAVDELAAEDLNRLVERIVLKALRAGTPRAEAAAQSDVLGMGQLLPNQLHEKRSAERDTSALVEMERDLTARRFDVMLGDMAKTDAIAMADEIIGQAKDEVSRVRRDHAAGKLYALLDIDAADQVARDYGAASVEGLVSMSNVDLVRAEESMKRRLESARKILEEAQAMDNLANAEVDSAQDNLSRVAALRRQARLLEESGVAPKGYFDEVDSWYRREVYDKSTLRPERYGELLFDPATNKTEKQNGTIDGYIALAGERATLPQTLEDAISNLMDIVEFGAARARKSALTHYGRDVTTSRVPVGPDGAKVTAEEYAAIREAAYREKVNEEILNAGALDQQKNEDERRVATNEAAARIMRRQRIKPQDVGFRGDVIHIQGDPVRQAAKWLSERMPTRPSIAGPTRIGLHEATDLQLEALVDEAKAGGASKYVFDLLAAEAARRAANEPAVSTKANERGPAAQTVAAAELNKTVGEQEAAEQFVALRKREEPRTWMGRAAAKAADSARWLQGWFSTVPRQLHRTIARGFTGKKVNDLIQVVRDAQEAGEAQSHVIVHQAITLREKFVGAVNDYIRRENAAGRKVDRDEVSIRMRRAYKSGEYESVGDDGLAVFLRDVWAPAQTEMSRYIHDHVQDPVLRRTIQDNFARYSHNSYGAFRDPNIALKDIKTESSAYKRFVETIRKKNYGAFRDEIANQNRQKLLDMGKSEGEANAIIENLVNARVQHEANSIIMAHFRPPGTKPKISKEIAKANADYLKDRVLDDEDLQEILGLEERLDVSAALLAEDVARDVERLVVRQSILDAMHQAGLLSKPGEVPHPSHSMKFSDTSFSSDPNKILLDGGGVEYNAHPAAVAVVESLDQGFSAFSQTANRVISGLKLNMLLSVGNWASQKFGMPVTMIQHGGLGAFIKYYLSRPQERHRARLYAREMSSPGAVERSARGEAPWYARISEKDLKKAGLTREQFDADIHEMLELGLGQPGEIAHQIKSSQRALFDGTSVNGSALQQINEKMGKYYQLVLRSDTTARAWLYMQLQSELAKKAGVSSPTPELKKMAAKAVMEGVQDPSTTPNILRAINRGAPGLVLFNFASFNWQVFRNVKNSSKMALKDWVIASRKMAEGDKRSAMVHARYAVDRTAGLYMSLYGIAQLVRTALFDDDDETKNFLRAIAYEDSKNADLVGPGRFGGELIDVDGDGEYVVNYYQLTSGNLNEPIVRGAKAMAAALRAIQDNEPGAAQEATGIIAKEIYGQFAGTGLLLQLGMELIGARSSRVDLMPKARRSLDEETTILDLPGEAKVTGYGLRRAAERLIPAGIRPLWKGAQSQVEALQDPYSSMSYESVPENILVRHTMGITKHSVKLHVALGRAFDNAWKKHSGELSAARRKYQATESMLERQQILLETEKKWEMAYDDLIDIVAASAERGISPSMIQRNVFDHKDKNTGRAYSAVPKSVRKSLALGRPYMDVREYLDGD